MIFFVIRTPGIWDASELAILGGIMTAVSLIGWHLSSRTMPKRMYVRKMMAIHGAFIATGLLLAFVAFVYRLNG